MAKTAIATIAITKIVSAIGMIQSISPIEEAAKSERNWFIATVVWLLIGAAITGLLTVLLYRKTGRYQATVKSDADARIAEAGAIASRANADAVKANEGLAKADLEIAKLNTEAEKAKTERAEANKQIEIAKADAARAKEGIANAEARSLEASVEVSRLRVTVANAEKQRLEAQKALIELQERLKHRHLTDEQRQAFIARLKMSKGTFRIVAVIEQEAVDFKDEILAALLAAGWVETPNSDFAALSFKGVELRIRNPANKVPSNVHALVDAFKVIGTPVTELIVESADIAEGDVMIRIGSRP